MGDEEGLIVRKSCLDAKFSIPNSVDMMKTPLLPVAAVLEDPRNDGRSLNRILQSQDVADVVKDFAAQISPLPLLLG